VLLIGFMPVTLGVNMETVKAIKPSFVKTKVSKSCVHSNEKGGVGKTTVEFNQAYRLAEQGYRVLIVDFDGQRNMSKLILGSINEVEWIERNGFTSAELFRDNVDESEFRVYQSPIHPNLHIIPSHKEKIAGVLAAGKDSVKMVGNPKKYLDRLDFDFILIDTPPSLGITQVAAINAVDYIFVPVTIDDFSNEGLISLLTTVKAVKRNLRSKVELGGVYINFFKKPTERKGKNPYRDILNQIERDYKSFLIDGYIQDSLSIKEARMAGRACWVSPPNGNAATVGRKFRNAIDAINKRMM